MEEAAAGASMKRPMWPYNPISYALYECCSQKGVFNQFAKFDQNF